MEKVKIPLSLARQLALRSQLLLGAAERPSAKEGVAQTIKELGYVQIDTIAVVQRAHHHTLWTRQPDYEPQMLHELQALDRRVFEYWAHAASYVPMSDYRYYLPRMLKLSEPGNMWAGERLEKHRHLMGPVLERIREEGPLTSKDFKAPPGTQRGQWWDWKPAKVVLEQLFWQGDLMIAERRNFQRVYDLTERVLPHDVDTRFPDDDELGEFHVQRALSAYGVAREREIQDHIRAANRAVVANSLADLVDTGEVMRVEVEGDEGADYYVLAETLKTLGRQEKNPARVALLSPFDNLIIQRQRTERLFGFEYRLECYVPAAKRKYGYFALPILWGNEFVGRLDSKADRKTKTFIVRGLWFEPGFVDFDAFLPPFVDCLSAFARFNQCESVVFENVSRAKLVEPLTRLLTNTGLAL
jgi:uncharacterized protein YcaQ